MSIDNRREDTSVQKSGSLTAKETWINVQGDLLVSVVTDCLAIMEKYDNTVGLKQERANHKRAHALFEMAAKMIARDLLNLRIVERWTANQDPAELLRLQSAASWVTRHPGWSAGVNAGVCPAGNVGERCCQ